MVSRTISIPVDPNTAEAFQAAPAEQQRRLQVLLGLRLRELTSQPGRPLEEILDDVGRAAAAQGLTPAMLESMLGES